MFDMLSQDREIFDRRLTKINWDCESGMESDALLDLCRVQLAEGEANNKPRAMIAAKLYENILSGAQLEQEPQNLFTGKFNLPHRIIPSQFTMWRWYGIDASELRQRTRNVADSGCFGTYPDLDHCTTDWDNIMDCGIVGLIDKNRKARKLHQEKGTLDFEKTVAYDSNEITLTAIRNFVIRLSIQAEKMANRNEKYKDRLLLSMNTLRNLADNPPQNLFEALQLGLIFYLLNYELEIPLNSLGGIDRIYDHFYRKDIMNGTLTREQAIDMVGYFLLNCRTGIQTAEVAERHGNNIGNSFFIGGAGNEGQTVVTDFTFVVLTAYRRIRIQVPKISIRINKNTPPGFFKEILINMRDHNMHYVLLNDEVAITSLRQVGISREDAYAYAPIGCYEPSVVGREIGSTGWPWLSIPKALELALYNGTDPISGQYVGIETGDCENFSSFSDIYNAVKAQLGYQLKKAMEMQIEIEHYYPQIVPTPILSSAMRDSISSGINSFAGGVKYNNSSITAGGIAELIDSLIIIKDLVYSKHELTMSVFKQILFNDWADHELLRTKCLKYDIKWGNGKSEADDIGVDISNFISEIVNNKPNGRGGVFKAGLMGIILRQQEFGKTLGALPSGRKDHEYLPKNNNANPGMDRAGITGLINSVTRIDYSKFPNGSVTDIMLHPSAIHGEEGFIAFEGIIKTYFDKGGYGIQFNIFDVNTLKDAQLHPQKYANLQIRVSGWNVLFINLRKEEQNMFIRQAEQAGA